MGKKMGFFDKYKKTIMISIVTIMVVGFGINEIYGRSLIKAFLYPVLKNTSSVTQGIAGFVDEKYIHDEQEAEIHRLEEENAKLRKENEA